MFVCLCWLFHFFLSFFFKLYSVCVCLNANPIYWLFTNIFIITLKYFWLTSISVDKYIIHEKKLSLVSAFSWNSVCFTIFNLFWPLNFQIDCYSFQIFFDNYSLNFWRPLNFKYFLTVKSKNPIQGKCALVSHKWPRSSNLCSSPLHLMCLCQIFLSSLHILGYDSTYLINVHFFESSLKDLEVLNIFMFQVCSKFYSFHRNWSRK